MELKEFAQYDGLGLADLVHRRQVSPKELSLLFLEAVEKINPLINAIIEVYKERVDEFDEKPLSDALFAGVPFLLKDLGASEAGKRQEMGSRLAAGNVSEVESYLTRRFKDAGLNILGRTTAPEFGNAGTSESLLNGVTRNPWDMGRIAGGSSGGAAAAVAAGILPLAHASDSGGSIRIPASCCGLVGLKPSRGRISQSPKSDEDIGGFGQELVVSRTVRDTAAILDIASKPAPGDPYIIAQPLRPFTEEVGLPQEPLRIAFTTKTFMGDALEPEVELAVRTIAEKCEQMGHHIEEAMPKADYAAFEEVYSVIWYSGLPRIIDNLAAKMHRIPSLETLEPVIYDAYKQAKSFTLDQLLRALPVLNTIRRQVGPFFEDYDLMLTPTLPTLPVPLGTVHLNQPLTIQEFRKFDLAYFPFTELFNLTGQPAISLPLYQSESGLPIGLQFAARFGEEATLIRVASAFEQELPWIGRKPQVHVSADDISGFVEDYP